MPTNPLITYGADDAVSPGDANAAELEDGAGDGAGDGAASDQDLDDQDSNPRPHFNFNLDTPTLKPASPPTLRDSNTTGLTP